MAESWGLASLERVHFVGGQVRAWLGVPDHRQRPATPVPEVSVEALGQPTEANRLEGAHPSFAGPPIDSSDDACAHVRLSQFQPLPVEPPRDAERPHVRCHDETVDRSNRHRRRELLGEHSPIGNAKPSLLEADACSADQLVVEESCKVNGVRVGGILAS